ncbi:hypothetical protein KB213_10575 [Neokomagataea sp. TBRC 2177]|uniref:Peptidase A1 domain-containing protein n=2 Tax=Neokomagataea anthophila TaxID=2826925 RepID=A0ABS5E9B2_9PROT|nr:hypothetical protein [Neokomagataea anthophila]
MSEYKKILCFRIGDGALDLRVTKKNYLSMVSAFCCLFLFRPAFSAEPTSNVRPGCFDFSWVGSRELPRKKVGMMVPVEVNGQHGYLQLDTGAPTTVLYGEVSDQLHLTAGGQNSLVPNSFCAGNVCWSDLSLGIDRKKKINGTKVIGHIGLNVFSGHIVLIDYPKKNVCILKNEEDVKSFSWSSAILENNTFYITGNVGSKNFHHLLFDTGSSLFTIQIPPVIWASIPGDTAGAPAIVGGTYDGKSSVIVSKIANDGVTIGPITLRRPVVYQSSDALADVIANRGADGLIGNAAFFRNTIILDLRDPARFGVSNDLFDNERDLKSSN